MNLYTNRKHLLKTIEDIRLENNGVYPGFLFLRHVLAFLIIAVHTRGLVMGPKIAEDIVSNAPHTLITPPTGYIETLWSSATVKPGGYALVGAFFAVSGFLVAGSAIRTGSVKTFLAFRALRIFPALISEVTLCALVLGPITTTASLSEYFSSEQFKGYFLNILGSAHYTLPGVFESNPTPKIINANLWTLAPEFYCYLIMAILICFRILKRYMIFESAIIICTICVAVVERFSLFDLSTRAATTSRFSAWFIVYMFFLGVFFHKYAHKIVMNGYIFGICALGYYTLMIHGGFDTIASWLLVYIAIFVGMINSKRFDNMIGGRDYSYGLYLYGLPFGQLASLILIVIVGAQKGYLTIIITLIFTSIIAVCFSALSWQYIEKPALRLKGLLVDPRSIASSQCQKET